MRKVDNDALFPVNENEVVDGVTYYHGEFNFHTYSSTNGVSPAGSTQYAGQPYAAADLNGDGVISVYESSVWAFDKEPYLLFHNMAILVA